MDPIIPFKDLYARLERLVEDQEFSEALGVSREALTACQREFPLSSATYIPHQNVLRYQAVIYEALGQPEEAALKKKDAVDLSLKYDTQPRAEGEARSGHILTDKKKDLPP